MEMEPDLAAFSSKNVEEKPINDVAFSQRGEGEHNTTRKQESCFSREQD